MSGSAPTARRQQSDKAGGFTILELMIVVVIIGVLAASAIQAYFVFINRARTVEAYDYLGMIYRNSSRYAMDSNEAVDRSSGGAAVGAQFPRTVGITPAASCCAEADGKCTPNWDIWEAHETWRALDFNVPDAHRFRFSYDSEGSGPGAFFTARASADFDCDGNLSTYERCGYLSSAGDEVIGSPGIYQFQPME